MKTKHSIKRQFAITFIALMAGTILMCWCFNSAFLENYYISYKEKTLLKTYRELNSATVEGRMESKKFQVEFYKTCVTHNINFLVVGADTRMIYTSVNDYESILRQLVDKIILGEKDKDQILRQTDQYTVQKTYDPNWGSNFIEMWGVLDDGKLFLMRLSVEGIQDSVKIANRFLMYVGIISILISGIFIWSITTRVTNPILQLAKISERMKNLDFDVRYEGSDKNEIGVLGEHINQLSDTLEQTISELKTANNELQNDIRKKEEIDEMRKEFLSNVSHELKTPIALIMGYAEGLQEGINDDESSREFYCDVIMDEASKMNIMVKKLLTLNQLEFGNDVVTMERFDLVELVSNYIQSADILIKQFGVKVEFERPEPIYVWGDEFKVEEVFMNYFTNAINYAIGSKTIRIHIIKEGDRVRTTVFNTGNQIPEESIPQLWAKFYKVDKARTREYGGSGVGLSIVKAIMESMNQEYGVNNCEDGVEFWFELTSK